VSIYLVVTLYKITKLTEMQESFRTHPLQPPDNMDEGSLESTTPTPTALENSWLHCTRRFIVLSSQKQFKEDIVGLVAFKYSRGSSRPQLKAIVC